MKRILSIWLIFFLALINLRAQQIPADTLVTLSFDNIQLKEALNQLSSKYHIQFSYSDSKIAVNDTINGVYNAIPLRDVLNSILQKNGINYNFIGNQIVLFPFNKNQTITIRGKILDKSTGLPVPYANIALSETSRGTASNEDGEFQLALTKLPSELLISHLAHEKKLVYVYDDSEKLSIELRSSPTTLKEVTVSAKKGDSFSYQLVKKAYRTLSKTNHLAKYGKAFYRQKSSRENKFTEIFEIFYDVKYTPNGITDWAVQEGRYAFQNENEYDIFLYNKNYTLLSRLFPLLQPETDSFILPLNPKVKNLFDLELMDVLKFDERLIAVIEFTPRPDVSESAANGKLYIDMESYEVLKMKGTITDEDIEIISFSDDNSNWENSELNFEISFIENLSGELQMDYVQIEHRFDYFFKKTRIGNINTSSILTFYEHYQPGKNKKLGGAIDFRSSDMDVIDEVGYDKEFWVQNPIVKRTPIEEKLIRDFENNDAFGVVFLNNEQKVVLLPDHEDSKKTREHIKKFEDQNMKSSNQQIFIRLDKERYNTGESLQFAAYILDGWTKKPDLFGSILFIELYNQKNQLLMDERFDINHGMAYGEIDLSDIILDDILKLKAFTNTDKSNVFEKRISITNHHPSKKLELAATAVNFDNLNFKVFPEGQNLIYDVKTKMVFKIETVAGKPVETTCNLVDEAGFQLMSIETNSLGYGSFDYIPNKNSTNYMTIAGLDSQYKWKLPDASSSGLNLQINPDMSRSLAIQIVMKPYLPKEVHLLSAAQGKVHSYYVKQLNSSRTIIELPTAHLPGGINTLIALDKMGNELGRRTFYRPPNELEFEMLSANWLSKKKARLTFKVKNQDGYPVQAHLSTICSSTKPDCTNKCDIRNQIYFNSIPDLELVDLDAKRDSIMTLVNEVLIANDKLTEYVQPTLNSKNYHDNLYESSSTEHFPEQFVAEISVSTNFTSSDKARRKNQLTREQKSTKKDNTYWVPAISQNDQGIFEIEFKIESKVKPIYVHLQGVSTSGLLGDRVFIVDPFSIKSGKRNN